jgi:hypothetical protein
MGLQNDLENCYDVGLKGLVMAGNSYDESKECEFSSYAVACIKYELLKYIRSKKCNKRKANYNTISLDAIIYTDRSNNNITLLDILDNGENLEEDILQLAFSNYDRTVYYNEYDIQDYLVLGENYIEVTLGNFWYCEQERTAWEFNEAPWKDTLKFIAEIYMDDKLLLKSDRSWECAKSQIVFNSLRCGEKYDATQVVRYYKMADVLLPPGGKLRKQYIPPITIGTIEWE